MNDHYTTQTTIGIRQSRYGRADEPPQLRLLGVLIIRRTLGDGWKITIGLWWRMWQFVLLRYHSERRGRTVYQLQRVHKVRGKER